MAEVKIFFKLFETLRAGLSREEVIKDLRRKLTRMLVGTFLIICAFFVYNNYGLEVVKNMMLVMVLFAVGADYLRLNFKVRIPFLDPFVVHGYEQQGFQGTTFAGLGVLLTLAFSDFDIAMTATAMFMYGDALASIFGKIFGKTKIWGRNKTLVGTFSMLAINIPIGFVILHDLHTAVFMALLATLVELCITTPADDFAIPLFTALGGQFFGAVLGIRSYLEGFSAAVLLFVLTAVGATVFIYLFNLMAKLWQKKSST